MSNIEYAPRGIDQLSVSVRAYDYQSVNITENVENITLFESIFAPFIHGWITLLDNSSLASVLPWIGQEFIYISFVRHGELFRRRFESTGIESVKQGSTDSTGRYRVNIVTEALIGNARAPISYAFCEPSHKVIEELYEMIPWSGTIQDVEVEGKETINVVFPYMKPLQAIDIILKNCLAEDDTPMFLFDRLFGKMFNIWGEPSCELTSLKKMSDKSPICDLIPLNAVHDMQNIQRGEVYEHSVTKAFKTLEQLSNGNYKSMHRVYDLSKKTRVEEEFFWKDDAPHLGRGSDWIPDVSYFMFHVNHIAKWFMTPQNEKAFDNDFPNLYGTNELDRIIHRSYMDRVSTSVVNVHMDSVVVTAQTGDPFTVGKTVNYYMPTFAPITDETKDLRENLVLSGRYIISAIRHSITDGRYTMSVELVRDFMGEEASLR